MGDFKSKGLEIGELVERKNAVYGDSFARAGDVLRVLYPKGVKPEQYVDLLGVVRVLDKLFRLATDPNALGESPWTDIAGYGVLGAVRIDAIRKASQDVIKKARQELTKEQ